MNKGTKPDLMGLPLDELIIKRKSIRRALAEGEHLHSVRIAVLGGSTTNEVVDLLELWLLEAGFRSVFYQSEYGRYHVEAVHDTAALEDFKPNIVYVHTSVGVIQRFPQLKATDEEVNEAVQAELGRFEEIWSSLEEKLGCVVIQNNFEFPPRAILGNLDAWLGGGHTRFVTALNQEFARAASARPNLILQDVCSIAARVGLDNWFEPDRWFSYKLATSLMGSRALAISLSAIVQAIYGRTRKVLVLDLDNTIWGGVIGDDGVDRIQIGRETPLAEAYTAFQEYCLSLRNRGVLLAVCSKNDENIARQGFEHPDSILKLDHISCFKANWDPKHENIALIAEELNLGIDSFVFIDDNPAERAIVEGQLQGIAVPDVGADVSAYASIIEAGRYFEQISFSNEDVERAAVYKGNAQRAVFAAKFANYGEYLDSLEMTAEIDESKPLYLERMTQLTNKTNQFNLTTRRYTLAEMEAKLKDSNTVCIYGKLSDRFGDSGLISIVLGNRRGNTLDIDLWLMSCRVLKRDMEVAMLDALAERAQEMGVKKLLGYYFPTKKNAMVADHYAKLGFALETESADGTAVFSLEIVGYKARNTHIRVEQMQQH